MFQKTCKTLGYIEIIVFKNSSAFFRNRKKASILDESINSSVIREVTVEQIIHREPYTRDHFI